VKPLKLKFIAEIKPASVKKEVVSLKLPNREIEKAYDLAVIFIIVVSILTAKFVKLTSN
jgi:indole-3-glycerol phosphate synthase